MELSDRPNMVGWKTRHWRKKSQDKTVQYTNAAEGQENDGQDNSGQNYKAR